MPPTCPRGTSRRRRRSAGGRRPVARPGGCPAPGGPPGGRRRGSRRRPPAGCRALGGVHAGVRRGCLRASLRLLGSGSSGGTAWLEGERVVLTGHYAARPAARGEDSRTTVGSAARPFRGELGQEEWAGRTG